MKQEKAAYQTSEYRGCRVTGYYGKDGVGLVEVHQGTTLKLSAEVPAYKIWNYSAHNDELIDSVLDDPQPVPTPVEPKAQVESASVEKVDVFEVYGASARDRGWDFLVCKTIEDVLAYVESDIDGLEDGEEVKIVFRQYTKEQMDEVIYE